MISLTNHQQVSRIEKEFPYSRTYACARTLSFYTFYFHNLHRKRHNKQNFKEIHTINPLFSSQYLPQEYKETGKPIEFSTKMTEFSQKKSDFLHKNIGDFSKNVGGFLRNIGENYGTL